MNTATIIQHYRHTLEAMGNQKGLLALILKMSKKKFQNPAKPRRVIWQPCSLISLLHFCKNRKH